MFIKAFFLGGGGVEGLVEITFGLVHANMPFGQAIKLTFFATCTASHAVDLRAAA